MIIDGKEISEETIKQACEAYGISFEKKFGPIQIHHGCFVVNVVRGKDVRITTGDDYSSSGCLQGPDTAREFIKAIEAAIEYIENKK